MNRALFTLSTTPSVDTFIRITSPVAGAARNAHALTAAGMSVPTANPDALAARCDAR